MKIIDAYISDPRREGEFRNPYLTVEVDENVKETGEPVNHLKWEIAQHGPFTAIDEVELNGRHKDGDLGVFNTLNLHKHRFVEVVVVSPEEEIDLSISLDRARRMLRKYDLGWRYVLDDVAGQHGKLLWRLVEQVPMCVEDVNIRAVTDVYYRGTHLSLCARHHAAHNKFIRDLRVNS